MLPRYEWSLLDRDVLSWLVGQDEPDRDLLLAIQEVRSIIEPAAAALAAQRATKKIAGGSTPEGAFERIAAARGLPVPDTDEQRRWVFDHTAAVHAPLAP